MSFFNQFPKIKYDLKANNILHDAIDIFRNVDVNDILADANNAYLLYDIPDGDRPDIVSRRLYGDVRYYWTFFIINDHLKNGVLDSWPKSSGELERFLEDQYDAYSVIELLPIKNSYTSTVNGIDLSYENLRVSVKSLIDDEATGGSYAPRWKIFKYDSNRYQLWIDAPASIGHFNLLKAQNDGLVLTLVNEVVGTSPEAIVARDAVTAKNNAWLGVNSSGTELGSGFLLWVKTYHNPQVYSNITQFLLNNHNANNTYKCMHMVNFKPDANVINNTWFVGRDAPIAFKDSAGNNVTTHRERNRQQPPLMDLIGLTDPISYADYEIALNDDKRKIRVLPLNLIRQFSEEYEAKLNV